MSIHADGFKVILADPPWSHADQLPGPKRGAASHYGVLHSEEIEAFLHVTLQLPVAEDAWLFLWRVASMPEEAINVVNSWGFIPKAEVAWVKTGACKACNGVGWTQHGPDYRFKHWCEACEGKGWKLRIGMGHSVRMAHEIMIVAKRGRPERARADIPSVIFAPRGQHSAKPEASYRLIEALTGNATPRIELFARKRRPNWDAHGLELPEVAPKETRHVDTVQR